MQKKETILSNVILIYALLVSFCYVLPCLKYTIPYIGLAILLLITVPLYVLFSKNRNFILLFFVLICAGVSGYLQFVVTSGGDLVAGINEIIRYVRFFCPFFLFLLIKDYCTKKQIILFVIIFSGIVALVLLITFLALLIEPTMTRLLAMGLMNDDRLLPYRLKNIGGFEFCYSLLFLEIFLSWFIFNKEKKPLIRVVFACVALFVLIFIYKTQYMILLILTILFITFSFISNLSNLSTKLIVFLSLLFFLFVTPQFLLVLSDASFTQVLTASRLRGFINVIYGGNIEEISTRFVKYRDSFLLFLHSPIWGQRIENSQSHSTFLSLLEGTGLIGCIAFYIGAAIVFARQRFELNNSKCLSFLFAAFIILSILNPISYCFEISFVSMLYVPSLLLIFRKDHL